MDETAYEKSKILKPLLRVHDIRSRNGIRHHAALLGYFSKPLRLLATGAQQVWQTVHPEDLLSIPHVRMCS